MGKRTSAYHNTSVTVRYAGDHETHVESILDTLRIMLPGLIITITDLNAVWCIWKGWHEAADIAPQIFTDERATPYLISPVTRIQTAVTITGWQPGRQVWGKTRTHSASGCGELRVRVGGLTIICDDRPAFDRQLATWALAYDTGKRITWRGKLADI
ncbi:hypothetical protein [Nonomuraea aridisoli]|uniref:Uncharacterized protein n=1 Tax=Nonomuraea aridisoli TaxID=2070368 RepID=A0A2W2E929_9ACTN|nr:hypothetical protein [Nonomuraea aridisoli]PZG20622.1 hypothetical protein C1J01_08965 [Nonomuraea aridisoli]